MFVSIYTRCVFIHIFCRFVYLLWRHCSPTIEQKAQKPKRIWTKNTRNLADHRCGAWPQIISKIIVKSKPTICFFYLNLAPFIHTIRWNPQNNSNESIDLFSINWFVEFLNCIEIAILLVYVCYAMSQFTIYIYISNIQCKKKQSYSLHKNPSKESIVSYIYMRGLQKQSEKKLRLCLQTSIDDVFYYLCTCVQNV